MRYVVYGIPGDLAGRVTLVPTDPRDGPIESRPVADGTALQASLDLLSCCSLSDLNVLRLDLLPRVLRKVAAEERAARQLERETQKAEHEAQVARTGVISAATVQREFDKAAAEEWQQEIAEGDGGGS